MVNQNKVNRNQSFYDSFPSLTEEQENIIIGSLLGDGSLRPISKNYPNSYFCKNQCLISYEHIAWVGEKLKPYTNGVRKVFKTKELTYENKKPVYKQIERTHKDWLITTFSHPVFTELRKKWYPDGKKIIPKDIVLNDQLLAVWFVDDGTNDYKKRRAVFYTNGFSVKDVEFLVERLEADCNIISHISTCKSRNFKPTLNIYSKSYDLLIEKISPYIIWECFAYKKLHRNKSLNRCCGENSPSHKLTNILVAELLLSHKQGIGVSSLSRKYGISRNSIYKILNKKTWKAINV